MYMRTSRRDTNGNNMSSKFDLYWSNDAVDIKRRTKRVSAERHLQSGIAERDNYQSWI
jgi:hypothetical protein